MTAHEAQPEPINAHREEVEEVALLTAALPARVVTALDALARPGLIEVVLDLGRVPTAHYTSSEEQLDTAEVTEQEIEHVVAQISEFGEDNRAGVPRTLHRISAIRNRRGRIVGLTCRVGRSVTGSSSGHSRPRRVGTQHPAAGPTRRRQDHDAA